MMEILFIATNLLFFTMMFYFLILTFIGLYKKIRPTNIPELVKYPTVDVLIPAHNEGVVLEDTLTAMSQLQYPGRLRIYLLNDQSTDETAEIADRFAKSFPHIFHIRVPDGKPKGKSRVLNYGLRISDGEYFVVYDGDNQPEKYAVKKLVEAVCSRENAVGAVGTVRTINADTNTLTQMIALEFQVFQIGLQVGRWFAHRLGSLPGTNMLLRRATLSELGGYDEKALAEDAELTVRLASKGYEIVIQPFAVTWEQEPEKFKVLLKQRTRWLQGNLYLILKFFKNPSWWLGKGTLHLFYYLSIYVLFPAILLFSNILFILGIFDIYQLDIAIPFVFIWFLAYFIYTVQIILAQWFDSTLTPKNFVIALVMYFSYAQLFIVVLVRAVFQLIVQLRGEVHWEKTTRVQVKERVQEKVLT